MRLIDHERQTGEIRARWRRVMEGQWFAAGCLLMVLGVAAGAFAAHGLKDRLSADNLDIWQTAARYHVYHALALLAVAYASTRWSAGLVAGAGWLFVAGIMLFSGSLYVLALTDIKVLGAITPLGGLCFLAGWCCLGLAAWHG
jgi:uncharacterized membrane protein YgdD (TMEM256/DUF423 family)